jgi:hypothetical protein
MKLLGRIVVVLLILALCWWGYRKFQETKQDTNGGVQWLKGKPSAAEKAAFDYKNSGGSDPGMITGPVPPQQQPPAGTAAQQAAIAAKTEPVQGSTSTNQPPADQRDGKEQRYGLGLTTTPPPGVPPVGSTTSAASTPAPAPGQTVSALSSTVPAYDSMGPNAPEGVRYGSGSGTFGFYRQGNLTYRIDTATGQTCIAFATLDEWRKPIVMKNGCRRRT